jgi:hypothetical protein
MTAIDIAFAQPKNPPAADGDSSFAYCFNGAETIVEGSRGDDLSVEFAACIQVVVVRVETCLFQAMRLLLIQHPQGRARFQAERLDLSHHAQNSFEGLTVRSASPRSSHAETRCAAFLRMLGRGSDLIKRKQRLARHVRSVVSGLRAIAAILRAAASLDGKQHTTLNVGGMMPLQMHLMCPIHQFEKWKAIKLERAFKKWIHEYLSKSMGCERRTFKHGLVSS